MTSNKVFGQPYSDAYDVLYRDKDYKGECDIFEAACKRFAGLPISSVVDFGCGTGSHALELARRGYSVAGIDMSAAMLESARSKLSTALESGAPCDVRFVEGDVAEAKIDGKFDAAIMMFAVLGYQLTNDRVLTTLANVRHHLRKGGLFICDFWYGPAVLAERPGERMRIAEIGTKRILRSARTDVDSFRHTAQVHFHLWTLNGDTLVSETQESHGMRYFFPQEIISFLRQCGFETLSLTAFPSLVKPLDDHSWNALLVAHAA